MKQSLLPIVRAAFAYAALVMAGGFVMGAARELVLAPAFGQALGGLLEAPLMALVIVLAARLTLRLTPLSTNRQRRVAMGLLSLCFVLIAEVALSPLVRGSLQAWIDSFTPLSLVVAICLWIAHAAMPAAINADPARGD